MYQKHEILTLSFNFLALVSLSKSHGNTLLLPIIHWGILALFITSFPTVPNKKQKQLHHEPALFYYNFILGKKRGVIQPSIYCFLRRRVGGTHLWLRYVEVIWHIRLLKYTPIEICVPFFLGHYPHMSDSENLM